MPLKNRKILNPHVISLLSIAVFRLSESSNIACSVIIIITRSYYRKESAASPPRDQRQHAQFAE
jgi:hypothetical protein